MVVVLLCVVVSLFVFVVLVVDCLFFYVLSCFFFGWGCCLVSLFVCLCSCLRDRF